MADPEGWCCLIDEFVNIHNLSGIALVTNLSKALKGDAADWLIRCRPLGKSWDEIRTEFISSFSKPTDVMELFDEAVNGRRHSPPETTLLDEGLHALRLALHLIKTCESDEELATLFACHVVSPLNYYGKGYKWTHRKTSKGSVSRCAVQRVNGQRYFGLIIILARSAVPLLTQQVKVIVRVNVGFRASAIRADKWVIRRMTAE